MTKKITRARPKVIDKRPPRTPGREPGRGRRRGPVDPPRPGNPPR